MKKILGIISICVGIAGGLYRIIADGAWGYGIFGALFFFALGWYLIRLSKR